MKDAIKNPEDRYFVRIAEKAIGLREKISNPARYIFTTLPEQETARLLKEWMSAAAGGDPEKFARLLANDGLDAAKIPELLGTATFTDPDMIPDWVDDFRNIIGFLEKHNPAATEGSAAEMFSETDLKEIPFIDLLAPFAAFATGELEKTMDIPLDSLLTDNAYRMMKTQLVRSLLSAAGNTLLLEFRVFRSTRESALDKLFGIAGKETPGNELYRAFTDRFCKGGWKDLFAEYCVLARILTTLIVNWIRNYRQFLVRLSDDLSEIAGKLADGVATGRVVELKGGISDLHDHGRSVIMLKFESGLKVVYKPRNLRVEEAWSAWIRWFNDQGLTHVLKPLDVIIREEHGWVGFVEASPCSTMEDVKNFYLRMGSLIGMVYMLDGNDCHQENLIAAGEYPVLVDLESVMHSEAKAMSEEFTGHASFLAGSQLGHSVFRTGLLPSWITAKNGNLYDISGLGGYGHADSPYQRPDWQHINTDRMDILYRQGVIRRDSNLPVFNGEVQPPEPWAESIVEGFRSVYSLAIRKRNQVPVGLFVKNELRFILRTTRIYALILNHLRDPKYLRSGTEHGIRLEQITRAFLSDPAPNPLWPVLISEIRQMERNDVPIFRVESDGNELYDPDGLVCPDFIVTPAARQVALKVNGMDVSDMEKQIRFIKASLLFRNITPHGNPREVETTLPETTEILPVDPSEWIKSALSIARILEKEAIYSKDGSCTWLSAVIIPGANRYRVQPVSVDLYDGLSGIALFLSALQCKTGDPSVIALNEGVMKSLKAGIRHARKTKILTTPGSLGIGSGIPSVIYALIKIAGMLGDPTCISEASELGTMITHKIVDEDRSFDLLTGSAGCLLALHALHKVTGDRQALETAVYCGEHLLKHAREHEGEGFGWITLDNKVLSGYSHGQAGISFALMRLYEVTGDKRYHETAQRAMISENRLFHPDHRNWEDLRTSGDAEEPSPKFMTSWCHGAPGIGLSRLTAHMVGKGHVFMDDITTAMETTMNCPLYNRDHLCCGNLGRAEILLHSASITGNGEWREASARLAAQVMRRAQKSGRFTLFNSQNEEVFNPGFFQGLSGVGYALLRQAYPDQLPAVLNFE